MRRTIAPLLIAGAFFLPFALGCDEPKAPHVNAATGQLAGRLSAAKGITDMGQRNEALAKLARDAAEAGDGDIANQAITSITDMDVRNKVAYSAALQLAKAGKTDLATTTATHITDMDLRNKVLSKIAKGDTSE